MIYTFLTPVPGHPDLTRLDCCMTCAPIIVGPRWPGDNGQAFAETVALEHDASHDRAAQVSIAAAQIAWAEILHGPARTDGVAALDQLMTARADTIPINLGDHP